MPSPEARYDLTIIGSGPGGYVAAVRAAQLGLKTAVVEMAPLVGGTCLHWGCIPTKALLQTAEVLETTRHAGKFGVKVQSVELDMGAAHKFKDKVVASNTRGIEYLFKKNGITVLQGRGRLAGRGRVEVSPKSGDPSVVESKAVILATGSVIRGLPGVEFDGERIINSDHALGLRVVPASMIVLGGGAVGVEFASIFASFGAKVTPGHPCGKIHVQAKVLHPVRGTTFSASAVAHFSTGDVTIQLSRHGKSYVAGGKIKVPAGQTAGDVKVDIKIVYGGVNEPVITKVARIKAH